MYQFQDDNGCQVRLIFDQGFDASAEHVWVICQYQQQWLLTNHSKRGLEFPGGKVEQGETVLEAAKREVMEETGAHVKELHYIGQYEVDCGDKPFYKTIYFAEISELLDRDSYFETNGPVLLKELPQEISDCDEYSFIMKDQVLSLTLKQLAKRQLI